MRYGVLGDIHSSLSALDVTLAALERDRADVILSVGDVVGYGAAPAECIERLQDVNALVVKGNHDAACTGELDDCMFNEHARAAVRWTRKVLDRSQMSWLRELPLTLTLEHCQVSHGTLERPELFGYVQTTAEADPSLDVMALPVCFVGHTHVPVTMFRSRETPGRTGYTLAEDIDIRELVCSLVNVGSVGQPRDGDARTGYALFDSEAGTVVIRRLEYDIEAEAARIREAGLPHILADRLFLGL